MAEEIEGLYEAIKIDLRAVNLQGLSALTRYSLVRRAAELHDMWVMESLLDGGCPVNVRETDHDSPLHIAVGSHIKYNGTRMVTLLLEKGADVNCKNENGETPLHIAVEKGYCKIVELLLKFGADVDVDLFNAIRKGNLQETTALIDSQGASSGLLGGYSPLRLAVEANIVDIVKLLLDRSYPVNASVINHKSALHLAVENGNYEMVELLLEKGADVNSRNGNGKTPLHKAVERENLPIVELLLKCGADVNAKDNFGMTPLHFYNKYNALPKSEAVLLEIAKLLLNKGANINAQAGFDTTPLHMSTIRRLYSLADLLLSYNADTNLVDMNYDDFHTALHYAADDGALEIVSSLLAKGADVNAKLWSGRTALHLAVENNHEEVVELLLANGATVNSVDRYGDSLFHRLAAPSEFEFKETTCTVLLKWGADVNRKTETGKTALHLAASFYEQKPEFVEFLLENGADINIRCNSGETPMEISKAETRDLLLRHQAKLESLGLQVQESQISARYERGLEELRKSCQEEVLLLRSEFIDGTSVSYYDFVRKDVRFLAKYMDNENVVRAAESEEYRSKFPTYASMIKSQFRRGRARNKLLKSANQVFNQLIDLPDYCTEKIMDYLCDDDLTVLINV